MTAPGQAGGPVASPPAGTTKSTGLGVPIALMIVGAVVGIVLVVAGFVRLANSIGNSPTVPTPGTSSVQLEAGDHTLFAPTRGSTDVTITGPSGQRIPTSPLVGNQTLTSNGRTYYGFASVSIPSTGSYQFATERELGAGASEILIGPNVFGLVGLTFALVFGGAAFGGLLMTIGFVLLIVRLVRRGQAKRPSLPGPPPIPPKRRLLASRGMGRAGCSGTTGSERGCRPARRRTTVGATTAFGATEGSSGMISR